MNIQYEKVEINNQLPYLVRIFRKVNFEYPVHYHNREFELTATFGCSGTLIAGDTVTSFSSPDLVLTGPGLPHAWYEPVRSANSAKREVYVIHFREEILPASWLKSKDFIYFTDLFKNAMGGLQFSGKILHRVLPMIRNLCEGQSVENFTGIIEILNLLARSDEKQTLSEKRPSYFNKYKDRFAKVHEYILNHFREEIRLPEVAKVAELSNSAFSHYFRKHSLMNFSDFIIDLRLNHAAMLLGSGDKPVTTIAFESGFNSISNFNNQFSRKYDMSPGEFRKKRSFQKPEKSLI